MNIRINKQPYTKDMKTIKVGSIVSQKSGNRFGVTKIIDNNHFLAIWVGNNSFTDKTTFNGFMRRGDFKLDQSLFRATKNGFRKIAQAGGIWGLVNGDTSDSLLSLSLS